MVITARGVPNRHPLAGAGMDQHADADAAAAAEQVGDTVYGYPRRGLPLVAVLDPLAPFDFGVSYVACADLDCIVWLPVTPSSDADSMSSSSASTVTTYHRSHPLLQFLPLKLAEWISKTLADELSLSNSHNKWSSKLEDLNCILTRCLVSDRSSDNLHTFHSIELESDLY